MKPHKHTEYQLPEQTLMVVQEAAIPYGAGRGYFEYIQLSRDGIIKKALMNLGQQLSFSLSEIARVLHISERTLQRYADNEKL
ncbi:MAG TPA: antitoxin Xre-like helix-turn-helix domain-containing protein, partial [Chitinophaga sp.]|uniref:antitoxin Xre-like helix-turn-helix domain-containing protein n=1 Tax=Chitinophaga sp. TaxID=1869181 RepID=UPI002DBB00E6